MQFEVFERRARPTSTDPIMAIQRRGTISLNAAAYALLEREDIERDKKGRIHVELLFDRHDRIVAIRPANPGTTTYPVRRQPNSESYLLTGKAFTMYHGIPTEKTTQYSAREFGEGLIGFSLQEDEIKD